MAKWIKNNTGSDKTYVGQLISVGAYYELQAHEEMAWANNSELLTDIGSADALVAKDDSGNTDIVDVNDAINYLKDNLPQDVCVSNTVATDKGADSFDTVVSHNLIDNTTWPATNDSEWLNEPSAADKQLVIPKAEVQFTHDVKMATATTPVELYFDIWVYNPLFDPQTAVDPDDPTFIPGVSSGNPLRFLYSRNTFKSVKDCFDFGNDHYTMDATVDGLPSGVTTIRFDYDQKIILRGDQGAQIRFSLKDHSPMEGGANAFCTVSLVVREEDIA